MRVKSKYKKTLFKFSFIFNFISVAFLFVVRLSCQTQSYSYTVLKRNKTFHRRLVNLKRNLFTPHIVHVFIILFLFPLKLSVLLKIYVVSISFDEHSHK